MAKIVHAESAPAEKVHYSLGQEEFDLGEGADSFETDDRAVIASAEAHPWLTVEYDETEQVESFAQDTSISPEEDSQSAVNSVAFDVEEIRKLEESKRETDVERTAIDAGLDQAEPEFAGGVATTVAADDDNEEEFS